MREIRFETDSDASVPHIHEEMEILFVLSGRVAVMVDRVNFVLGPEDFVIFNSFEHHELYVASGSHTLSAYLSPDLLKQASLGNISCCSKLMPEKADYLRQIRIKLALIYKNHYETAEDRYLYVMAQIYELLSILRAQFYVGETAQASEGDSRQMLRVLRFISEHYREPFSLQDAADDSYLSKSYLSTKFHDYVGLSFSDYVRKKRLGRAAYDLAYTEHSVLQIALDCGFSNVNTFIINFRDEYQMTPGEYRRKQPAVREIVQVSVEAETPAGQNAYIYMALLKYAGMEETQLPLNKKYLSSIHVEADVRWDRGAFNCVHNIVIHVGWAELLFHENVQKAIRTAVNRIGFRFLMFHGILDDTLDVYHEDGEGNQLLSFTYVDLCLDFVLRTKAKPWLELGYTPARLVEEPANIFGNSCINLPDNLDKWKMLVCGLMEHLMDRYGLEELLTWRFMASSAVFAAYGVFPLERYFEYYKATYDCMKEILPGGYLSAGGFDTGFLVADEAHDLARFVQYCKENGCMPDAVNVQCFSCDYGQDERGAIEKKLSDRASMQDEPARISRDPSVLAHQLAACRECMDENGCQDTPIVVNSWNSTLWQCDLGNDTCYKSAFIIKNYLENVSGTDGIAYNYLTDNSERLVFQSGIFHGGFGLLTYQGIPKAGYRAFWILSTFAKNSEVLLQKGDGYVLTRSMNGRTVQILLYYYCHYDPETHITVALPRQEQCSTDRYLGFERNGIKNMEITLSNLDTGYYHKYSYIINRDSGSSYDAWMDMGFPEQLNELQEEYLESVSVPKEEYDAAFIDNSGKLLLSAALDEHEVRLIILKKK